MYSFTVQAIHAANNGEIRYYYNDKLKDGRRSLKVPYWSSQQYIRAIRFLLDNGCKVEMVKTGTKGYPESGHLRLHITEPKKN